MPPILSGVDPGSPEGCANRAAHLALIERIRLLEARVAATSARAETRFKARGQLLPRERVGLLLDAEAPFLELSPLCGLGLHEDDGEDEVYGGGCIAGIGFVSGARCVVLASVSSARATPLSR